MYVYDVYKHASFVEGPKVYIFRALLMLDLIEMS